MLGPVKNIKNNHIRFTNIVTHSYQFCHTFLYQDIKTVVELVNNAPYSVPFDLHSAVLLATEGFRSAYMYICSTLYMEWSAL